MNTRAGQWAIGFAVWTGLAILTTTQSVVRRELDNLPIDWDRLISGQLVNWYSCAVFTPAFFWAARRFPIDAGVWIRHLPVHLALCAAASAIKFVLEWTVMARVLGYPMPELGRIMTGGFVSENIAFWCLAAAIHAIEFQRRARERELLTARLQARLSEAHLTALTAQLHPHFLFNTLQGISTLVHRDPGAADAMLGHLSALLRKTLQGRPRQEVTLAEELTLADDYLAIAQARFGDRLTIEREVEPGTLAALVPCLALQPLLENAFEHGIARKAGSGRVTIRARRIDRDLELTVADDGYGPAAGALRDGVGLGSTRGRLTELYGARGVLTLAGRREGGTVATMRMPFHEAVAPRLAEVEA